MSVSFPESKKIAAVTGSRRGIGLAIARELAGADAAARVKKAIVYQ